MDFLSILGKLMQQSGFASMSWQSAVMLVLSFVLMYMAIVKKFEPLLLLPIAFGMFLSNLPSAETFSYFYEMEHWYDAGILGVMYMGVKSEFFPCMMFLAVGAMTDFGPLIANPISLLLGAAAQLGIYCAFTFANATGLFTPQQAAAIGIIGGADGPTAVYAANNLAPELVAPIAAAAYRYTALIPLIQPPLMRLLTTEKERKVKMKQLRKVSKAEKIIFPVFVAALCSLLLPSVAPLLGMLMLGNLMNECGVVDRLSETAQGPGRVLLLPRRRASAGQAARRDHPRQDQPSPRLCRRLRRSHGGPRRPERGCQGRPHQLPAHARHGSQCGGRHRQRDGSRLLYGVLPLIFECPGTPSAV